MGPAPHSQVVRPASVAFFKDPWHFFPMQSSPSQASERPLLTVICPVFNEEQTVPLFFERIRKVFEKLDGRFRTNLLFMDNHSTDRTPEIVQGLMQKFPWVYHIFLSRNFGYQCSVECGLRNAQGDYFVVVDVDCEDPPELILEFLKHHEQGYDIVYGERADRVENALIKFGRKVFYRFTRFVADEYFILDMAEFCLITREVRDAILQDANSFPFIRASIGRIGFNRKGIVYKRDRRIAGETHYNFWRMSTFAIAGILSSSTYFLRMAAYAFPFWFLAMAGFTVLDLMYEWHWCTTALLFSGFTFCGYTLVFIAIYLARIYKNTLNRPNFVIHHKKSHFQPAHGE